MDIKLNWAEFKDKVDSSESSISYIDMDGNYYLYCVIPLATLICILNKEDAADFEQNYKELSTSVL